MKILITGAAGFIGYHVSKNLLNQGHEVVGIDNINNYYDVNLKYARLESLGISREDSKPFLNTSISNTPSYSFEFTRMNIEDNRALSKLFHNHMFDVVCHLAAQAGVRYSLENPSSYIQSNIVGFANILELCKEIKVKNLVYASSSSVYGLNKKIPFSVTDNVDQPISLYAATKKSNELMAYTYSHLYNIPTTGLRFFTVYGPWGRPDMAYFLFTKAILNNKPITVYNNGDMERDFTYIDDIVEGVVKVIKKPASKTTPYLLYNIGNNKPVNLLSFIETIEEAIGKKAIKEFAPIQPGDVAITYADISNLMSNMGYAPKTNIEEGIKEFIAWYLSYYKIGAKVH